MRAEGGGKTFPEIKFEINLIIGKTDSAPPQREKGSLDFVSMLARRFSSKSFLIGFLL